MTLTELKERIKEEVVLHEGDLKEWQWRRNGLLTEAEQDGIASAEFMRLVNDVSYQIGGLFPRINSLKATAEAYARADKKQLLPLHLEEIVAEAERLTLSRAFVTKRWLPAILATIPDPPKTESVIGAAPAPAPVAAPAGLSREEVRQAIAGRLDRYKSQGTIPAWLLNELFQTTPVDGALLTEEIFSYLVSNFYKAAQEPQGNTLRERLVSTDWKNLLPGATPEPVEPYRADYTQRVEPQPVVRSFTAQPARVNKGETVTLAWEVENLLAVTIDDLGEGLSPNNRGWVKPTKTTDYTLFDANNNPLSTVRVEVIPRDRSGIYGVLFALALLALIYWFIKNTGSSAPERPRKSQTQERGDRTEEVPAQLAYLDTGDKAAAATEPAETITTETPVESATVASDTRPTVSKTPPEETPDVTSAPENRSGLSAKVAKPEYVEPTGDKPYDLIDNRIDEQGWRMARKGKNWGYVNEFDEWVIEPRYTAVTPFRDGKAAVFLNGQLMTINRLGETVKN